MSQQQKNKKQPKKQQSRLPVGPKPWANKKAGVAITSRRQAQGKQIAALKGTRTTADQLQKASGGHGIDPRSPVHQQSKSGTQRFLVDTQLSSIAQTAQISATSLSTLALGPVLLAIRHGWGGAGGGGVGSQQVYPAWVYLTQAYINAVNGTFPVFMTAPEWFWETVHMLVPKPSRFKTASINYNWECDQSSAWVPDPTYNIAGVNNVFFGTPGPSTTNEFPVLLAIPYTPTAGQDAIQALFKFFGDAKLSRNVADPGQGAFLAKDVSAFQAIYAEWGASAHSPGGLALTIESEVPLRCPMLAKFSPYQQTFWRGSQDLRKSAGTPCYIVPRMIELTDKRGLANKQSPIFKFYNFDHYFLILSYILAEALELSSSDNSTAPPAICPLTSLQMQICLRQAMIGRFANEMAQDLVMDGSNTIGLIPFSVGANGVSITNAAIGSLKLPFVLAENIRSAGRLTVITNEKFPNSSCDWVPVLSRPAIVDVPTLGNFLWFDKVSASYQEVYSTLPEVAIDLVDLGYGTTPREYITANGDQLGDLILTFNNWITTLGNHLTSLVTIGNEPGIAALSTVINTMHTRTIVPPTPPTTLVVGGPAPMKKTPSSKCVHKGAGVERKRLTLPKPQPGSSEYYQYVSVDSLSGTCPFESPLQRYLQAFVHPSYISYLGFNSEATINFRRVYQVEPFNLAYQAQLLDTTSSTGGVVSVDTVFLKAALMDIKTNLASPSEAQLELEEMAKVGNGGFFTSLASTIGDMVGVPAIRQVAEGVNKFWDV